MKTFKQYISESLDHIWTAIKHPSGKILRHHRNSEHADIRWKHADDEGKPAEGEKAGYYDSKAKKFMTRHEFSKVSGDGSGDSTRLRSSADRMKFAGDDPFGLEKSKGSVSSHDRQSAMAMARKGLFEKKQETR